MPAVLDVPSVVESVETAPLSGTLLPLQDVRPGLWKRMVRWMKRPRTTYHYEVFSEAPLPRPHLETHQELLARKYPALYIRIFSGV